MHLFKLGDVLTLLRSYDSSWVVLSRRNVPAEIRDKECGEWVRSLYVDHNYIDHLCFPAQ